MKIIKLVLVIVAVFSFIQNAHGRTIMLDEEQVETSTGKTIYILTMCNDGYEFIGYHTGNFLDLDIVQKFMANNNYKTPTPCQMDFKHESQLTK